MSTDTYASVLAGRYASKEMKWLWSDAKKFRTWRRLWTELARFQMQLGLPITPEQVAEMEAQTENIDYEMAKRLEEELRHDVVAHARTFGAVAPKAAPIIRMGATSCFVTDNTDLIVIRESLDLVLVRLARVIDRMRSVALRHKDLATLGYTHFQPAQPVTVGKRVAMWLQDLVMDLSMLEFTRGSLKFRGVKGTTGTQDSFLVLFKGDHSKVKELDTQVAYAFGFSKFFLVTGQTYTRKQDTRVLMALADLAATVHKIDTDLRILQHMKEIEEPFEVSQVGSSAMPYKRNPMRAERACGLSRRVMTSPLEALMTQALQWFERTLDDSSARRVYLPDAFLAVDAVLIILQNIFEGLVVYPKMIEKNLMAELPFMATERILMAMDEAGADHDECHERIRVHAQAAGDRVKLEGKDNDLLKRIRNDSYFAPIHDQLNDLVDPNSFVGRAPEQVEEFVKASVDPFLFHYKDRLGGESKLSV